MKYMVGEEEIGNRKKVEVTSSGISCAVNGMLWQLYGMNNWNKIAWVKGKQKMVEFLLGKRWR